MASVDPVHCDHDPIISLDVDNAGTIVAVTECFCRRCGKDLDTAAHLVGEKRDTVPDRTVMRTINVDGLRPWSEIRSNAKKPGDHH